jgi:putative nucleotidyltransferase with HDIG domain
LIRRRRLGRRILPALAVGAAAALVILTGAAAPLRRDAADLLVRAASLRPPAYPGSVPDVTIVAIDPQSLRALPDWPWSRQVHAGLVESLDAAGARAIGFDIDFSTPRDREGDARFAAAMAASGRVALAAFRQLQPVAGGAEVEVASVPIPQLFESAAAIGSVLARVDPDGVVRRFPRASRIRGRDTSSLAEACLSIALRDPPGTVAPIGIEAVDYRRFRPEVRNLSAVDVLEGRFDVGDVAGRIVLVGATAVEFQDLWTTPIAPAQPGVLIQALATRTLAARRAGLPILRVVPAGVEIVIALLLTVLAGALGSFSHARRSFGLSLLALATPAGCLLLLAGRGWLLDPVVPLGVLASHYLLGLESVRRRFGRRLAERELSLTTLFQLGEATGSPEEGGLDLALGLLGQVARADGVALLPSSSLDATRLEWRRRPGAAVGDPETAGRVLASGALRIFEGRIPGRAGSAGSAVYLPLRARDEAIGVLVVEREVSTPLDPTELRTVATAGAQLALSAQNLRLVEDLRRSFATSIVAIATAVEARDGYTEVHCERLAAFSVAVAERLEFGADELEAVRLGALLHDVGKIAIPDRVLLKPGSLTPSERTTMESHALIGERIVKAIHGIHDWTLACVRHHHERWNGGGYPDGLAGEDIPLAARIVGVVDVWDALSTKRPYKKARKEAMVRETLTKGRGVQFDPEIVDVFLRVLDEEGQELLALLPGREGAEL